MAKKIVVTNRISLAAPTFNKGAPPTPAQLRLLADRSMKKLEDLAERRANGKLRPEDEVEEITEWL